MEFIHCELCGSTRAEQVYEVNDWLLNRPNIKGILVRCLDCGLIYQNPRPTLMELDAHYPSRYQPYQVNMDAQPYLIRKAYEYGYSNRIYSVTRYKKGGKLLDLGCAAGEFLEQFRREPDWEVEGVDVSEYAVESARKKGLKVFSGTLEQAGYSTASFDAVTMWDVLEHLHQPKTTIHEIRRILKPGGILALRVPNGDSGDFKFFGRYWAGLDAPRHLYIFSHATIERILREEGFRIISSTTRLGSYIGFVLSVDFWLTARKTNTVRHRFIMNMLRHPAMRVFFAPIFYLYGSFGFGTSLTLTAEVE